MFFTTEDIVLHRAINNSDALDNGWYMSNVPSISGMKGNVFPDITQSERTLGSTLWRKVFWKNINSNNLTLRNVSTVMSSYTPGDDWVVFCKGSFEDKQSDVQDTTRFYGAAKLKNSISTGTLSVTATLENTNMNIFATGDTIRISNSVTNELHTNVTVVKNGLDVIITFDGLDSVINNYNNTDSIISSVLSIDNLVPTYTGLVNTSSSGIFDVNNSDILLYNIGSIYQLWTIKFFTTTQFTLNGNIVGYVGNGSTSLNFSPINPETNTPFLYLDNALWQGTWNVNDEVRFLTIPSAAAVWFKRIVPIGSSTSFNSFKHIIIGQAATQ